MRTVSVKSILHSVSRMLGVDPNTGDYTDAHTAALAAFLTQRVNEGWTWAFWPELMLSERRQYRESWASGTTYGLAAEVYYDGEYYYSLQAANTGNQPDTEDAWWVLVTDVDVDDYVFDRYVNLDQSWEDNPIGDVEGIYMRNPNSSDFPGELSFALSANGIEPSSLAAARIYVNFRQRPAEYSTDEWDTTTTYAEGDVVYLDGDCYKALQAGTGQNPTSAATYWKLQPLPYILVGFLKRAVYADMLREDGQDGRADRQEGQAQGLLANEWDVSGAQQGQFDTAVR